MQLKNYRKKLQKPSEFENSFYVFVLMFLQTKKAFLLRI